MCVIYAYVLVCVKHNLVRRELSDLASNNWYQSRKVRGRGAWRTEAAEELRGDVAATADRKSVV